MLQKVKVYKFWEAIKKYAEEKDISYSEALNELIPAYTARFYKLDSPRRYPDELLKKSKKLEKRYG